MTNKSMKRRNAVIAAVAGAALLVGGSTYALWQQSANMVGGTIQAGDLSIKAGTSTFWDVSEDRGDQTLDAITTPANENGVDGTTVTLDGLKAHAIPDLEDWTMVPGDTVALAFPYKITLDGDNMVAQLGLSVNDAMRQALSQTFEYQVSPDTSIDVPYLNMRYELIKPLDSNGPQARVDGDDITATSQADMPLTYFQAANQNDGELEGPSPDDPADQTITVVDNGGAVYVLVLYVNFDERTPNTDKTATELGLTNTLLDLTNNLTATLQQVRCDPQAPGSNFICS